MSLEQFLPSGVGPEDLITVMAGLAAFITVYAVWGAALARDPMRSRLRILQGRREALKAGYVAPRKRIKSASQTRSVSLMRQIVTRFQLLRTEQAHKTADRLAQAGWRSKDMVVVFMFFKLVSPVAAGVIAVVLLYGLGLTGMEPMVRLLSASGATIFAMLAPDMLVKNKIIKRQDAIRKAMPDALDLLVICAEAGLTLDAALHRVAREMGGSFPEIGDEFGLTAIELGFLPERRQALDNLAKRVSVPSVRSVVATLGQTERYGTPLAQSLRILANEFRNERLLKAEEKAARLPAILTLPLILFILPSLFIVLIGPAVLDVMDQFSKI
ncbi:MAG: type II secretion system F family protein [Sphingomonadales bacterium]